jgi:Bacterial membrane protein YfhO
MTRKEDGTAIAFLFAVAVLYFLPTLIKGNSEVLSSIGADVWAAYFYWRHFGFESLARGEIPLWNPFSFSGMPFVAGMESAMFYPPNFIYLLFGTAFSINLSLALHCFLGSLFTYRFAKYLGVARAGALLSALTFAYGAPCFLRVYAGHLVGLAALTWLPLLFLSAEAFLRSGRIRCALWGGVALAMQLLAGQPQYVFYSAIAVALYFAANFLVAKNLREAPYFFGGFCLFVTVGLLLSAVQLLPTLELTRHSVRNALGYEWVSTFSLPPENLVTLLAPDFFGDLLTVSYWGKNYLWEGSAYLGVTGLVMGAAAVAFNRSRAVWIFVVIAAAALVLALGKYTPVLGALYAYVPGFNLFRGQSKFMVVFSFAWSMLAGYGLSRVMTLAEEKNPGLLRLSHVIMALAGLLLVVVGLGEVGALDFQKTWTALVKRYERGVDDYTFGPIAHDFFSASLNLVFHDLLRAGAVLLLLGGLLWAAIKRQRLSTPLLTVSVLALTVLDLWTFGSRYLVSFNPQVLYMDRDLRDFFKSDNEPFRLATTLHTLLNVGFLEGTKDVGGYDQLTLRQYNEYINFSQGLPLDRPNFNMVIDRFSPMLRLLNARYYVLDASVNVQAPDLHPVFHNGQYKVYRDGKALPRSFVVHDARVAQNRQAALEAIASPTFDPTATAIVNEEIGGLPGNKSLRSPAPKIIEDSSNRVRLAADLKQAGLLVLSDAYYPGWKAFVDGKESRIYRANHTLRGVFLSQGEHVLEFRYDPLSFKLGAIISSASLILILGLLLAYRRKT